MTDSIAYSFKIYPVPSIIMLEEFYQFVRRLANQYENYRVTHCCTEKDGSVLMEFGSHFDLKSKPEKARRFKGLMDVILRRICPDRESKTILIENDQLVLGEGTWVKILSEKEKLIIELKSSTAQLTADHVIPLYEGVFIGAYRRLEVDLKNLSEVSIENQKLVIDLAYKKEKQFRSIRGRVQSMCDVDRLDKLRKLWLSGEYSSRDLCIDVGSRSLNISFDVAREVLGNMPEPCRSL